MYSTFYLRQIARASVLYCFYRLFCRFWARRDLAGLGYHRQALRYRIKDARKFLEQAGITP